LVNEYRIGLDVDGVLANFWGAFCDLAGRPHLSNKWSSDWPKEEFDRFWNEIKDKVWFWENLPLLTNPVNIDFEVTAYITALPPAMADARQSWLQANGFPDAPLIVAPAKSKLDHIKNMGINVFVDDKPSTCKHLHENGIIALQYLPYYANYDNYTQGSRWNNVHHIKEVKEFLIVMDGHRQLNNKDRKLVH